MGSMLPYIAAPWILWDIDLHDIPPLIPVVKSILSYYFPFFYYVHIYIYYCPLSNSIISTLYFHYLHAPNPIMFGEKKRRATHARQA